MFSSLIEKIKKKRRTKGGIRATLILVFPLALVFLLLLNPPLIAAAYQIFIDNNVDADSNIDAVDNIGTSGQTYTSALTKDGVYQNITEADQGGIGIHNYDDPTDNATDTQSPSDLGTYSSFSAMQLKDTANNTLTEEQTATIDGDWDHFDHENADQDSSPDVGTETNPGQANDSINSLYMTVQEANQAPALEGGILPSVKDDILGAGDLTTSATYEDVDGLSVNITTSYTSDILVVASIQALGSTDSIGSWRIVFDGVAEHGLQRQLDDTYPGNIVLMDLIDDKPAGNYEIKLQHSISTGTLNSSNIELVAISLHNGDGIVPANDSYVASDTVGNSWEDVPGLTTEITLSRSSYIWAFSSWNGYHSSNNKDSTYAININSVRMEENKRDFTTSNEYGVISAVTLSGSALSAGTYTVKAEWKGVGGSTLTGEDFHLIVVAAEANSGDQTIDAQKVVISDSTSSTTLEDIDGGSVTGTVNNSAHILTILSLDTDVSVAGSSGYTAININGTDHEVMERGHSSAQQHGSVGHMTRTHNGDTIPEGGYIATGRWYTDSGNTLTAEGTLVSLVLYAGSSGAASSDDYELNFEYQWTSADNNDDNEQVIVNVQTAAQGGENLQAYEWDSSTWQSLGTISSNGNNTFTLTYLTGSTFTIKINDSDQSQESTQSTWSIDLITLRTYNDALYQFDRQINFINLNNSDENEEITIYTGDTMSDSEDLDIEVWNGAWNDIGDILNTQTDQWINISITTYLTGSELAFRIQGQSDASDTTQTTWEINYVGIHTWNNSVTNYRLEWEHQVQNVDPNKDAYNLTIFGYDDPPSDPDSPYYKMVELYGSRGQTYRHWYQGSTGRFRYSSAYLVNRTNTVDGTDWVTYSEYPNLYILRTTQGAIYRTDDADYMNEVLIPGTRENLWAVGIETFAGVFGIYLNFPDLDWGHGQYLYWPRLINGQISKFNQPLYGIYTHLYANYTGTWFDQILNDRTLYDTPSKNPRNTLTAFNNLGEIGFSFDTNNITISNSNWNFTHGIKFNIADRLYHMITRLLCTDRNFDDIGVAYEITSSPQTDGTPYQPDRFAIGNDTNSILTDLTLNWNASDYLNNYVSTVDIISKNNESFTVSFLDMELAGFTKKYLGTHDQQFPNGSIRKVLRVGMYGYGAYTQGNWINIDPTYSEKQSNDFLDLWGELDGGVYTVYTSSVQGLAMLWGYNGIGDEEANASSTFETGIRAYIYDMSNPVMTLWHNSEYLETGEYNGIGLYRNPMLIGGYWDELKADLDAQSRQDYMEQDMYWYNSSFFLDDTATLVNTTYGSDDAEQIISAWVTHHNVNPDNRSFLNLKFYPGTNTDSGEVDSMQAQEAQHSNVTRHPTITFEYDVGYVPVGAGASTGLTPFGELTNFQAVDDDMVDDDTTFVNASALTTANDTYEMSDAFNPVGEIDNVTVYHRSRATGPASFGWAIVYTYSTFYNGSISSAFDGVYTNYSYTWTTNPNTDSTWTWEEIDALEIGVRLEAGSSAESRCTRVWATVGVASADNEQFALEIWNSTASAWDDLATNITDTEQWFNVTFSSGYIDESDQVTWRYVDILQVADSTQDVLHIDYAGVSGWNVSIYWISAPFDSLTFSPDNTYHEFIDSPLSFQVESGENYIVQILGTDVVGSAIANGWIYFDTDSNPAGSTVLTTSYLNLYINQGAGNNTHQIWLWTNTNWVTGDAALVDGTRDIKLNITVTST